MYPLQTFVAVSGKDGSQLWTFEKNPQRNKIMNLYTPQYVQDFDGDGMPDILNIHGGDPFGEPGILSYSGFIPSQLEIIFF